jgi:hypothetical protein
VRKLMESRDTRGTRNKKQGILNYSLKFANPDESQSTHKETDIQKMKEIVFRGKPKRVYKSNKASDVTF